jgi:hypothetical protein
MIKKDGKVQIIISLGCLIFTLFNLMNGMKLVNVLINLGIISPSRRNLIGWISEFTS